MKFNLICIQSHNERPSKLNIDKKLKLIQSEFENIQHHTSQFKVIGLLVRS